MRECTLGRPFARAYAMMAVLASALAIFVAAPARAEDLPFHKQVDLTPLDAVAVFTDGRLKSFGSYANTQMQFISGPRKVAGQSPDFTYFDLLFRPDAYAKADVIYVKNREVRARIVQAAGADAQFRATEPDWEQHLRAFESTGLVSEQVLQIPGVRTELQAMEGDLIRTAKDMDMIKGVSQFQNQQTGYQAALQSYAQIQKLSLFNFIS